MKIAIIGAGFGGLSLAYFLTKKGVAVTVFEYGDQPGGLAVGFKENGWKWSMEKHYHHLFSSDYYILDLAQEIGQEIIFKSPKASTYFNDGIYQVDSPQTLITFSKMPILDRIRTGAVIVFLKFNPFWKILEKNTSENFINTFMGQISWNILWKPLFVKKFGNFENVVNAAWFWARIKKRTMKLGYPKGGFLEFAKKLKEKVEENGGKVHLNTRVESITPRNGRFDVNTPSKNYTFDKVISTLSAQQLTNLVHELPKNYSKSLKNLKSLGTINLVLELNKSFLNDGSYWLNVNEIDYPFLAVIEHTNFISKSHYANNHLLYVANYLPADHDYFNLSDSQLFDLYYPYLKKISKGFTKKYVKKMFVFKSKFTQPVVGKNHSKLVPAFETPIKGLYLCNMQQVYPWDRGTNYAVENALKVSELVIESNKR